MRTSHTVPTVTTARPPTLRTGTWRGAGSAHLKGPCACWAARCGSTLTSTLLSQQRGGRIRLQPGRGGRGSLAGVGPPDTSLTTQNKGSAPVPHSTHQPSSLRSVRRTRGLRIPEPAQWTVADRRLPSLPGGFPSGRRTRDTGDDQTLGKGLERPACQRPA